MNKSVKKILVLLLTLLLSLTLTSCDDTIAHNGGVDVTIPDEIVEHLVYTGDLPVFHFAYDGEVNVADFSTKCKYLFAKNDFYKFSDAFSKNFEPFIGTTINTKVTDQTNDDGAAKFGKDSLPLDEPQTYSKEIMSVVWDETGARFSFYYRTFVSGGKRYYTTPYTTNVTITMEVPLYVDRENNNNKLYLLNLPYDTKYEVSGNLNIDSLLKKDEYANEFYYKFEYPPYITSDDKIKGVKEWYEKYCNGYEENNHFYFTYLGNKFEVLFDVEVKETKGFQIKLVK